MAGRSPSIAPRCGRRRGAGRQIRAQGRSAYAHLLSIALTNGIPKRRVDEVMDLTGIAAVKTRKAGAFSLHEPAPVHRSRPCWVDPHNLVLDEPINGLDPEGVKWVRDLCRYYAAQGPPYC